MGMRPGKAKGPYVGPPTGGSTPLPPGFPDTFSQWFLFTVDHTQFQVAAKNFDIELWDMPARMVIQAVVFEPTIQFSAGINTDYKMALGVGGFLTKFMSYVDVDNPIVTNNFDKSHVLSPESISTTTSIRIAAYSVNANLDQSTSGELNVAILASKWRV